MNTLFAWMADLGIRLDDHEPDARQLEHIAAVRESKGQNGRASSPVTKLARALGFDPARAAANPMTSCCAA